MVAVVAAVVQTVAVAAVVVDSYENRRISINYLRRLDGQGHFLWDVSHFAVTVVVFFDYVDSVFVVIID